MAKAIKLSEERRQTLESWMDRYGTQVLRFVYTYFGNMTLARDAFIHTFVMACRQFDTLSSIGDDLCTVMSMAIQSCLSVDERQSVNSDSQMILLSDAEFDDTTQIPADSMLEKIANLPPELRLVLLVNAFASSDLSLLSRMFMLPKGLLQTRLQSALTQVTQVAQSPAAGGMETVRSHLEVVLKDVMVPEWLRIRASQQVRATLAQMNAERRHRGPAWLAYATLATCVFSAAAIGVGAARTRSPLPAVTLNTTGTEPVKGLPVPLQNLPGNLQAQYVIPNSFSLRDLDHMAIGKDAVYLTTLDKAADKPPTIQMSECPFSQTGSVITSAAQHIASLQTVSPAANGQNRARSKEPGWAVENWEVHVSDAWAVVIVHWAQVNDKNTTVTQIYNLYLPTGQSSLVKSTAVQKQQNESVVTAGDGKVIVQSGIQGKASVRGNAVIGLPIDVYTLSGTTPSRGLNGPTEIAAPFGLMEHPTLTGGTLVFQGIAGQPDDATAANATWYTLSWDGQLSRYAGPPLDGRPHWAVRGADGKFWWCETTPDGTIQTNMQVLMAPMEDASVAQQEAAQSLSGAVQFFTVSGESMAWVQNTKNITQLVIESVQ